MAMPGRSFNSEAYRYGYQGSEKDIEVSGEGNSYTTHYRQLDVRVARWKSIDPKATPWETPYASMGNNPILYNDVLGDTVKINHRKGFLGFGKSENLTYNEGNLYNADGSAYEGKVKGFLKQSVDALNDINSTETGGEMISELQDSENVFTIKRAYSTESTNSDGQLVISMIKPNHFDTVFDF